MADKALVAMDCIGVLHGLVSGIPIKNAVQRSIHVLNRCERQSQRVCLPMTYMHWSHVTSRLGDNRGYTGGERVGKQARHQSECTALSPSGIQSHKERC